MHDRPHAHRAPWGFGDGQLEALKWLALASMFTDHVGRHLLGLPDRSAAFTLGRLAFPLFALVLALNLAREGDRAQRAARTALRLAAWGVVAVLPSVWARGDPQMLNVLFTLSLGAALCWAFEAAQPVWLRALACLAFAAAGWWVEFGTVGVVLVAATYLACTLPGAGTAVFAAVVLLATGVLNAQFGGWPALAATVAAAPVALALRPLPLRLPRWKWLFYVVYPTHLALIGALKWLR